MGYLITPAFLKAVYVFTALLKPNIKKVSSVMNSAGTLAGLWAKIPIMWMAKTQECLQNKNMMSL